MTTLPPTLSILSHRLILRELSKDTPTSFVVSNLDVTQALIAKYANYEKLELDAECMNMALQTLQKASADVQKTSWEPPFEPCPEGSFVCFNNRAVRVQMLQEYGALKVFKNDSFKLVIKETDSIQLVVVIPKKSTTLKAVYERLTPRFFQECLESAHTVSDVAFKLPKIRSEFASSRVLNALKEEGFETDDLEINHSNITIDYTAKAASKKGYYDPLTVNALRPFAFFLTHAKIIYLQGVILDEKPLIPSNQGLAPLSYDAFVQGLTSDKTFTEFSKLLPDGLKDQKPYRIEVQITPNITCTTIYYVQGFDFSLDKNNFLHINRKTCFLNREKASLSGTKIECYVYEENDLLHCLFRGANDHKFPKHYTIAKDSTTLHKVDDAREKSYNERMAIATVSRRVLSLDEWNVVRTSDDIQSLSTHVPEEIRTISPRVEIQTLASGTKFQIINATNHDIQFDADCYPRINGMKIDNMPFTSDDCNFWVWTKDASTLRTLNRDINKTQEEPHIIDICLQPKRRV